MGLFRKYVNQTRKPEGFLGKMMILGMNSGHAKMADWGMDHLKDASPEEIVDMGCGGGRNAAELLRRYPGSEVTAIDYSSLSVEKASAFNAGAISEGRCTVLQNDVSKLTLDAKKYGIATAFETVYFWPGLEKCFSEVYRVLKDGGLFLIVNESDGMDETGRKFEKIIDGMKVYTTTEIEKALKAAGFSSVEAFHHDSKPWITVLARKGNA